MRYSEVYEGHRISALAWAKLSRNIEIELSLQDIKRKPCRDFLKVMRAEYDNLMESSPTIDLDVINMFNKKFEGKYNDVRKPIIVNGLREIKPYSQKIIKEDVDPETGEVNPNMVYPPEDAQPEPEPESEP